MILNVIFKFYSILKYDLIFKIKKIVSYVHFSTKLKYNFALKEMCLRNEK